MVCITFKMYYTQYIFLEKVLIHPCIFLTEINFFSTLMIDKSISVKVSFWTDFTEKNYANFILYRNKYLRLCKNTVQQWNFGFLLLQRLEKYNLGIYISAYFYSVSLKNFWFFFKLENLNCFKLLCIILEYFFR